jgi:hypothetical protein
VVVHTTTQVKAANEIGRAPTNTNIRASDVLKGKWIYLVGDSSMRMFSGALISLLNGTLEDPRFGSFIIQDKGGCTAFDGGCLREYIDFQTRIRVSYTFKTFVSQRATSMENLISPSQQPDIILLATGAWDGYKNRDKSGAAWGNATGDLLDQMMKDYPTSQIVVATLVSCYPTYKKIALTYNNELRRQVVSLSNSSARSNSLHLLDREPSTIFQSNRSLCEGWHAYGSVVLGHAEEFLNLF